MDKKADAISLERWVTRIFRVGILWLLVLGTLWGLLSDRGPAGSQTKPPVSSQASQGVSAPALQAPPWTGDLDGMLKRRYIRALVAYSKTQYYVVKGVQHGSSYEFLKAFEDAINKKYAQKQKNMRILVVFVPVPRDKMFSRLGRPGRSRGRRAHHHARSPEGGGFFRSSR